MLDADDAGDGEKKNIESFSKQSNKAMNCAGEKIWNWRKKLKEKLF